MRTDRNVKCKKCMHKAVALKALNEENKDLKKMIRWLDVMNARYKEEWEESLEKLPIGISPQSET